MTNGPDRESDGNRQAGGNVVSIAAAFDESGRPKSGKRSPQRNWPWTPDELKQLADLREEGIKLGFFTGGGHDNESFVYGFTASFPGQDTPQEVLRLKKIELNKGLHYMLTLPPVNGVKEDSFSCTTQDFQRFVDDAKMALNRYYGQNFQRDTRPIYSPRGH